MSLLTHGLARAEAPPDDWSLTRERPARAGATHTHVGTARRHEPAELSRQKLFRALLASPSDDYVLEQLLALERAETGSLEGLLERLDSARARQPNDEKVHQARARVLFALQRVEPALAELEEAARHAADVAPTRELEARLLRELGRSAEAAQRMLALGRESQRPTPQRARWLRDAARDELAAGDPEQALTLLTEAQALGGARLTGELLPLWQAALRQVGRLSELGALLERTRAWVGAAEVWEEYGDQARALRAYAVRLAQAADDLSARAARARLLAQAGRLDEAQRDLKELMRRAPKEPSYVVLWAELERDREGQAVALLRLAKHVAQRPALPALHRALRELYLRWNEPALAEQELHTLARLGPEDPESELLLAERALAQGERARALSLLTKLSGLGDRQTAELRLARMLGERDLLPEAIEHARRAVTSSGKQTEPRRTLASLLERAGEIVAAERVWQELARLQPTDEAAQREVREHLVSLWRRAGTDRLHAAELTAQLRAGPFDLRGAHLLLELYARDPQQRAAEAALIDQLLAHAPTDLLALTSRARSQREQRDIAGALRTSARILELGGPGAEAHALAALELASSYPRADEVPRLIERARSVAPRDGRLERLAGAIFLRRQQPDLARAAYERALSLDPGDFVARYALAEDAFGRGDTGRAEAFLQTILEGATDDALIVQASQLLLQSTGDRGVDFLLRRLSPSDPDPTRRRIVMAYYERNVLPLADAPVSAASAQRLQRAVGRAGGLLMRALSSGDAHERSVALALLIAAPLPNAVWPLLALAERADAPLSLRARALVALGCARDARVAARLHVLYARTSRQLRPFVVWAVAECEPRGAVDLLRAALTDGDPNLRGMASLAAWRAGQLVLAPSLGALSADPWPPVRAAATWALAGLAPHGAQSTHEPVEPIDTSSAMLLLTAPNATPLLLEHALFADAEPLRALAAQLLTRARAPAAPLPIPDWPLQFDAYLARLARSRVASQTPRQLALDAWAELGRLASERLRDPSRSAETLALLEPFEGGLLPDALLAGAACSDAQSARALALALRPVLAELALGMPPSDRVRARELLIASGGAERPELVEALRGSRGQERRALLESLAHASIVPGGALRAALQDVLASASDWPTRMWAARALGSGAVVLAHEPVALVRTAATYSTAARAGSTGCSASGPVTN